MANAMFTLVEELLTSFDLNWTIYRPKKSFYMIWHELIHRKIGKFRIQGTLLNWFSSYLTNHKEVVIVNNVESNFENMEVEIPEGSLLGVWLFFVLINNLNSCLKYSNALLYADYTIIYLIWQNLWFIQIKLQYDIN